MNNIDKRFSFHTLFSKKFSVTQRDLGRKLNQGLTKDAEECFFSKEVEVRVDEIVIPKLQRDYAQGRPNEKEVRENFLQSLYDAIADETGQKRCSLNFLYGHFLESREREGTVSFVPYDGQQRLTTLFLLHWYASRRENDSEEYLRRFRYDTRFSSTTFTTMFLPEIKNLLLSEAEAEWLSGLQVPNAVAGKMVPPETIEGKGVFSRWLMNKNGFAESWQDDPTVRGMLEMLDAIHAKFHNASSLWSRLRETDSARLPVYFYFQEVARSADAGSIFIKMNSRGKLLTEFECFKADFLRLLRKGGYPEGKRKALAEKINKTWEQTFWKYAQRQGIRETDTDVLLMRYVNFVIDLIGFERNVIQNQNKRLHLYSPERLKKIVLTSDGLLDETAVEEMAFAVDTWCGPGEESKPDVYFQRVFRKEESESCAEGESSRIRLFFNPAPEDIFKAIINSAELPINAIAVFYAVLVARRLELPQDRFDLRMRSVRNLVYSMDKGVNELPYILQKVRLVMERGVKSVDFRNEGSQRKFIDSQIREETFKEKLADNGSPWYRKIRELEELDWFKGQVGVLFSEILEETDDSKKSRFLESTYKNRVAHFKRLFCCEKVPDSIIRKVLFRALDAGFNYWVVSKSSFWMGASIDDFAWKAARPFFTREGKTQEALRAVLDHPFFDAEKRSGKALLEAFACRPRSESGEGKDAFDVVYYLNRYYDDFFERWAEGESNGQSKCVGRIFFEYNGLTMQMLAGKTRSSLYWDPYLYVALKHVNKESVEKDNERGKFRGLLKQYDVWVKYSIVHRKSNAEIWNDADGVHFKASAECHRSIKGASDLDIEMEVVEQAPAETRDTEYLLRTRFGNDQKYKDRLDRIEVCKKLLKALINSYSER